MNQQKTPVYDGLIEYRRKQAYSFHVPGHKDGQVFPEKAESVFKSILTIDATEVADLDDLYHPEGILREAQQLLAAYYGARASYFLVNGSTVGNLTMVLATCDPGDIVFVQRDSHKSVFNALKMAQVRPVFIAPSVDSGSGLATGIELQTFVECMNRYPQAKALILTYPSYYGIASKSVGQLIACAHEQGLHVLVDEAHGPHFKIGAPVPPSALDLGADLVVHSAHKMLPAMTMGAYLHVNSTRVSLDKIERVRAMLQSSSPSYPIMASLDLARYYMAALDSVRIGRMLARRDAFVQSLCSIGRLSILHADSDQFMLDPFKVVIQPNTRENGFEIQRRLIASGLYPEMADPRHILLVLGLSEDINYEETFRCINQVISKCAPGFSADQEQVPSFPKFSSLVDSYRNLATMGSEHRELNQAVDRTAAESVIPYPPGIPIVVEGERVTERGLELIRYWQNAGAVFQNECMDQGKIKVYHSREQHKNDT
ncbi:aminotransferase class I/II-fold pyridoxal phosphate-dependent enzyme [Sporolactobacillus shoreicorticis]|uniref:Aminotransferase class I/II-fold pyridoxal phosphate-dependent enzyme n=1 Tax=Sporolactobacillus shoreicorticis TaxID=1923877 RepID=A0ABW5S7U4_9BACL|nr:aminotransferase class I/II-fold pyridoxal phosphate-dependent enzyme [Sporolactobacillus shoreicorticis]MCO7127707.1 aminotransferase class I/II-fold pyridoxal phosphate-dependent enzyme [Sporolactobacillus shoreicorticis]